MPFSRSPLDPEKNLTPGEIKEIEGILKKLADKCHEKAVDLTRRYSVLLFKLGEREATGQPVEDLEAEMEEIDRAATELAALRNRARGAANTLSDEFWYKVSMEKRRAAGEHVERASGFDESTERLYEIVMEVRRNRNILEDEEWWRNLLGLSGGDKKGGSSPVWEAIEALRFAKALLFPRDVPRVYTSREEAIGLGTSSVKAKLEEDIQRVINLCNKLEELLSGVRIENIEGRIMREHIINDMRQIREGMEKLLREVKEGSVDESTQDSLVGEDLHTLLERISKIVQYIADKGTAKDLENKGQELMQVLTSLGRLYRFYRTLVKVHEGVHEDKRLETIFATGWNLKGGIIDDIREVLELMDELEASAMMVQVSAENKFGQEVKNKFINAVMEAKNAMMNAFDELVEEKGLVKLSDKTEADFLRWTNQGPGGNAIIFTVGVRNFIHFCEVKDESTKQVLEEKGKEIFVILGRLEWWYKNYRDTCRLYEEHKAKSEGRWGS